MSVLCNVVFKNNNGITISTEEAVKVITYGLEEEESGYGENAHGLIKEYLDKELIPRLKNGENFHDIRYEAIADASNYYNVMTGITSQPDSTKYDEEVAHDNWAAAYYKYHILTLIELWSNQVRLVSEQV
jgi:hypothetical protein